MVVVVCWRAVTGSLAISLAATLDASLPPDTVTVLVGNGGALAATSTVSVIGGYDAPAARTFAVVHVAVATVQVQPLPLMAVAVKDAGRASATVTVPLLAAPPTLEILMVNVSPVLALVKGSVWLFVMWMSGAGTHG